ncbi:hypothetical protein EYR36_012034 [Pleurotus pulmonarius]|nr:hypothetical protein EYR36_012034 [Pleurotus pulmonarius]
MPVLRVLTFDIDNAEPEDLMSKVCAHLDIERCKAKLGWKSGDDKKRAPHQDIQSADDVQQAFQSLGRLFTKQRKRPAIMEIVNLEPPTEPAKLEKSDGKPSETVIDPELLRKVKEKLACADHPGPNRWCYVRKDGKHTEVKLSDIGYWTREIHLEDGASSKSHMSSHTRKSLSAPKVHVHLDTTAFEARLAALADLDNIPGRAKLSSLGKRDRPIKDSDDESDAEPEPIAVLLHTLHAKKPAYNFPQYWEALEAKGICYTHTVLEFSQEYYRCEVKMADGAATELYGSVKRLIKRRKAAQKRARQQGKEN